MIRKIFYFVFLAFVSVALSSPSFADEKTRYIIQFQDRFIGDTKGIRLVLKRSIRSLGGGANLKEKDFAKTFEGVISGVVAELSLAEVEEIKKLSYVKHIEQDRLQYPSMGWGLDRVNQSSLPLDNDFSRAYRGAGVDIYIVDTGINDSHSEFSGRVGSQYSAVSGGTTDCNGHGTHVASIAAGSSVGVASDATIHSIRISNNCSSGSAHTSDIISGLNWVVQNANPKSIVNYSYESNSESLMFALQNIIMHGHVLVTSGGNDNEDACSSRTELKPQAALRVAVSTISDSKAKYSNYGPCLNLFAPGDNIIGADYRNTTQYISKSGTSMASPFVAGAAASYWQRFPQADPYEVMEAILEGGTLGTVSETNRTPNILLFTDIDQPSSYWQQTAIIQSPIWNQSLPKPGCSEGQRHIYAPNGPNYPGYYFVCQ